MSVTPPCDALPMASDPSTAPASPGLISQVATLSGQLGAIVADLDPHTLLGSDAARLYAEVAKMERLLGAAKCLLAPRIADTGHWESEGHRSPADLLAALEGVGTGHARRTLQTGQRLGGLPGMEGALRSGALSGPKAALLVDTATIDPSSESDLLAGAADERMVATKERCRRVRATSAGHDPVATARRVHAERRFSHWTDDDGAFCYSGKDSAERGAALMARLIPAAIRLREAGRAEANGVTPRPGAPEAGAEPHPEPEVALRADALFALVTGSQVPRMPSPGSGVVRSDEAAPSAPGPSDTGPSDGKCTVGSGLQDADDLATRPPPTTLIVRVDRDALVRGRALPGELCELDGAGPVPVPLARALAVDSYLTFVFTEAGDIRAVAHLGRTINAKLRTALTFRDRCCVVPGCGMPYGLEIDHVHPMALGGVTTLDNLALLCAHHHRLKTYDGWVLERHGPSDADPRWSFTPQPPFGQEPDLGLDRPQAGPAAAGAFPAPAPPGPGTLSDRPPEIVPRR